LFRIRFSQNNVKEIALYNIKLFQKSLLVTF
jgi:hypothetical protein